MIDFKSGEMVAMYDGGKRQIAEVFDGVVSHAGLLLVHAEGKTYFPHIKQLRKLKNRRVIWINILALTKMDTDPFYTAAIHVTEPPMPQNFTKFIEVKDK